MRASARPRAATLATIAGALVACGNPAAPRSPSIAVPEPPPPAVEPVAPAPTPDPPPPPPLVIAAPSALHFTRVADVPAPPGRRVARAVTRDRVVELWTDARAQLSITVVPTGGESPTTIALPRALQVGVAPRAAVHDDGTTIEVIVLRHDGAGGVARWSATGGWTTPIELGGERHLGATFSISRLRDGWLVLPYHTGASHAWVFERTGARAIPMTIGPGAYAGATQVLDGAIALGDGALVLVADSSSADGKAAGSPGRTRAVLYRRGRFTELGAPFPLMGRAAITAVAAGPAVALLRRTSRGDTRLTVVDPRGRIEDVATPAGPPATLRWVGGALIAWTVRDPVAIATTDQQYLAAPHPRGWRWSPGGKAAVALEPPPGTPPYWGAAWAAQVGDELCAWGGSAGPWDRVATLSSTELYRQHQPVEGAICVGATGAPRLVAATDPIRIRPPVEYQRGSFPRPCAVVADAALVTCPTPRDGDERWLVSATAPP
ncbi:MAG TPA: hypothetical protein VM734_00940 [Kofleriaceae bacterium]|nr:hypothetical protein [Kofleriaceae bacterium]